MPDYQARKKIRRMHASLRHFVRKWRDRWRRLVGPKGHVVVQVGLDLRLKGLFLYSGGVLFLVDLSNK